jgi:hypothetical protein
MPRPSIEYLNARRAAKAASGGTNYRLRERAEYAPDSEADGYDIARNAIGAFSLWAELTRQQLAAKLSIPQINGECDELPF